MFSTLAKRFQREGEDDLTCDQYFCTADRRQYYLIEQKVRDDHDSTKKRGQIENFRRKLVYLKSLHDTSFSGIMYFIDPALHKNETYYRQAISLIQIELEIPVNLYYNGELFQQLQGHTQMWSLLLDSLQTWRKSVPNEIALDYDANSEKTLEELLSISTASWKKLIETETLWTSGVIRALFPTGRTLRLLENHLQMLGTHSSTDKRTSVSYQRLAGVLNTQLLKHYSTSPG